MGLTYTGTNGLFTRLGTIIYMMDAIRAHQTNLRTLFANIQDEYASTDRYMIDQLSGKLEERIAEAGSVLDDVRAAAEKTLVEMCFAEAQVSTTNAMRSKTVIDALVWLIRQMDADTKTIDGTTIGKSSLTLGASNNGNGTFTYLFDAPNILLGSTADWPNIRTELMEVRCVQDAQDGAVNSGSEIFEIRGQPSYPPLDYRFPAGSGTTMRMTSLCANVDQGGRYQNILRNSDLEDWTSNIPDGFTVSSGTAGTDFISTTTAFRGTNGLRAPATSTVWKIRQQLGSQSGTLARLTPDRPYVIAFAAKKDAGATGTIRVSVQDSSGNIISSGAFAISQSVATLTTSWVIYSLTIRAPRVIPTDTYLVVEATTGVATAAAYIDEVILAEMPTIAPGGQALAIISGSSNWFADDYANYSFTNNSEGAVAIGFDRLFDMYGKGLSLPANYAGGENIPDTVIA